MQDVVAHLTGTDQFWAISFSAGLRGEPTRFLTTFDPVATPAQMVDATRSLTPAEVLARYHDNVAGLEAVVVNLDADRWSMSVEAPPGHVALRVAALHALWDVWIHERDIVIPLGLSPVEESDEVELTLRYAVALSPAFHAADGSAHAGTLTVTTTQPPLSLRVEAGTSVRVTDGDKDAKTPKLRGRAVDLIEGLSFRAPLTHDLADDDAWLLTGLGQVFDKE